MAKKEGDGTDWENGGRGMGTDFVLCLGLGAKMVRGWVAPVLL
jgi:hypothetical protein